MSLNNSKAGNIKMKLRRFDYGAASFLLGLSYMNGRVKSIVRVTVSPDLFPHDGVVVCDKTGGSDGEQPSKEQAYPQELPDATGMIYPPQAV